MSMGESALEMVRAHASARPHHTAVVMGGAVTSYHNLVSRAGEIAGALVEDGVRPGDTVGIALPASAERVAAVLATWWVGAAYVPVDADDPRYAAMVSDAGCASVVRPGFPRGAAVPDSELRGGAAPAVEPRRAAVPCVELTAADVACVTYTSGSTGSPNGVLLTHGGIVGHLAYLSKTHALGRDDVTLQIAPFTFDAWIRDCLGPLTAGATVWMLDEFAGKSSASILAALQTGGVTRLMHSVPSMLRDLTATARRMNAHITTVRTVLSSGEPLRHADCAELRAVFGHKVTIVNQYGPTECTMTSTYHRVTSTAGEGMAPIGDPIPNARLHVLTEEGAIAPAGVTGEIHLTGEGTSHGYLGRPRLTADRFVPDPFASRPGQRLFRTGDLGRYRPDGTVELLGRRDQQIKVRGKRVEPGEIETVLATHDAVTHAVVVPSPDKGGLEAYVVPAGECEVDKLSAWLAVRLPDHMVPRSITLIDELPRTPHGKIDRRRLVPARSTTRPRPDTERRELERIIAGTFRQVLGIDQVATGDSFFRLGGHSLLATRLVYELGLTLRVKLPLSSIFQSPTVAGLAERVERLMRDRTEEAAAIAPIGERRHYAVSSAQRRVWLAGQLDPVGAGANVQITLKAARPLDAAVLRRALEFLTLRHEVLRTTFTMSDREPVQVINPAGAVALPEVDLRGAADTEAELGREVLAHSSAVFDLERGPLWRARLVSTGAAEQVLLLAMHHVVIDEWSVGLLLEELSHIYEAFADGREPDLPDLPLRYVDYAAWERDRLTQRRQDALSAYWTRQLDGAPSHIPLTSGGAAAGRGARLSRRLDQAATARLVRTAEDRGATLYMITLAVFALLLAHRAKRRDLVIGSPVAGREAPELTSIVGFFVNILPIRVRLSDGGAPFTDLLDRTRETALGAFAHQDLPFDKLVELVEPERRPYRTPLIQNWFVLHNTPLPDESGFELMERQSDTAKFDVNMALTETPDGLTIAVEYDTDLFSRAEAEALLNHYRSLLDLVSADPGVTLDTLTRAIEGTDDHMATHQRRSSFVGTTRARKTVRVAREDLVMTGDLTRDGGMPLLVEPGAGAAVDLAGWIADNREQVRGRLLERGAVLFRGFGIDDVDAFQQVVRAYSPAMLDYYERSTPRSEVSGKVYSSTEYPPDRRIPLHSESAYSSYWPRTLWFACLLPAGRGGATPVADTREILQRLSPGLRERFAERKVMYVRNFHEGFDIPWQVAFQTQDRRVVEEYCEKAGMEWEWRSGGVLRTRHVLDAIVRHPDTGAGVWFNQVHAYHLSSLSPEEQRALRATFTDDDLPRNVLYGDGGVIAEEDFHAIADAHHRAQASWPWRAGDVLLVDNMLAAHGRDPYEGKRKVVVAMTDAMNRAELAVRHA